MSLANEIEDLNSFGVTLGLPGNVMSGIMESSKDKAEIVKDLLEVSDSSFCVGVTLL